MDEYHKYIYEGPVMEFDKLISDHWYGETMAISEKKARSNLSYRFKKENHRTTGTSIKLPGKIVKVD